MKTAIACILICGLAVVVVYFARTTPASSRPDLEDGAESTPINAARSTPAEYWPRFRGPDGSGVSADLRVPTEWSDTRNLRWKLALPGPGSSSPIVWKDRVFVTCYSGYGDGGNGSVAALKRHLLCVRTTDGKLLWAKEVPSAVQEDPYKGYLVEHGYASNTPATDGERVYVFFSKTGVLAFDFDGNQLWQTSVGTQSANRRWGSAASLILYNDFVIVNAAEESRSIQALDRKTGKVVWTTSEASALELCYGTPLIASGADGRQDLVIAVPNEFWGMNPATGKLRWFAKTPLESNVCPSVVAGNGLAVAFGGYPATKSIAVRLGGKGDVTSSHVAWTSKYSSYVSSPVIKGEHLFWVNDRGIAYCLELATGNKVGDVRLPVEDSGGASRCVYAATLLINDKLLAVTRRGGVFVLEATPKLTQLACNQFKNDDSDFNAAPAVSNGQLFLRSNRFLYCVAKTPE